MQGNRYPNSSTLRNIGPNVLLAALLLVSAAAALSLPDFGQIGDFLNGRYPTSAGALAIVTLIAWIVVIVATLVVAMETTRTMIKNQSEYMHRRMVQAVLYFLVGTTIFAFGLVRHSHDDTRLCCGSTAEALQLAQ